jgi:hypothetical protein
VKEDVASSPLGVINNLITSFQSVFILSNCCFESLLILVKKVLESNRHHHALCSSDHEVY